MTDKRLYCEVIDCDREVVEGRDKCSGHTKQMQRSGKISPLTPKLTPRQRLIESIIATADADADSDFDAGVRGVIAAVKAIVLPPRRGRGRPPKVDPVEVTRLLQRLEVAVVARKLGVHVDTVYRIRKKSRIFTKRSST